MPGLSATKRILIQADVFVTLPVPRGGIETTSRRSGLFAYAPAFCTALESITHRTAGGGGGKAEA